ncbi:MAG: hypothetical protein M1814_004718 [Vezdaea aestivalis]|nr:MAG: hypothetical protein M1814_004718 [Vezdaea aestivalis]
MADEERRLKRSRFDKTEPEARKGSRFDRRSRSPSTREHHSGRSRTRSPLRRDRQSPSDAASSNPKSPIDATAAAAAAAARISAQLKARKAPQPVDVPPIQSAINPGPKSGSPSSASNINPEIYIDDGDYIKDIEVNDLRNRYTLTKGSTQKMIKEETGADVTTRGSYYPEKSMATAANPPLYLHVTSTSKAGLEQAVQKIEELMKQELPNLVDERRFRRREPEQVERDELGRRKWPEEKIVIDIDPVQGFNLRAQVVGHGGAYVKHIQQETRCRVQIKGRGSAFVDQQTNQESDEPMFLHVAGPDAKEVQRAKELCEDLIQNVKQQHQNFKERPPQQYGGGGGGYGNSGGQRRDQGGYGGYGGYGNAQSSAPSTMSPTTAPPGVPGAAGSSDYYSQYYGGAGGQDPYAAYGGYQNYMAYYQYYQQQAAQQQQSGAPGSAPAGDAPPPPPPGGAQQPPPPPSGSPPGLSGYNAVPPPPGL